eukprot:evm.model.NODE_23439_length_20542_cov_57.477898.4
MIAAFVELAADLSGGAEVAGLQVGQDRVNHACGESERRTKGHAVTAAAAAAAGGACDCTGRRWASSSGSLDLRKGRGQRRGHGDDGSAFFPLPLLLVPKRAATKSAPMESLMWQ